MFMKPVSVLLLCVLSGTALSQDELSGLIEAWKDTTRTVQERLQTAKDLHITFHQTYPDTVLFYLEEMRDLAERSDRPLELYSAHNRIGSLNQILGRTEEAFAAFDQAEQVAIALGDSVRLGTVYGNRGNVHVRLLRHSGNEVRKDGPVARRHEGVDGPEVTIRWKSVF